MVSLLRRVLIWGGLLALLIATGLAAATSPLLEWRDPVYILAGATGIVAMVCVLFQALLIAGYLPGIARPKGRALHRWVGAALLSSVVAHVGALWLTSPPDVVDVLLLRSPTPFSIWGVIAMWAVFAAAALALMRKRSGMRPQVWRRWHAGVAALIVVGTVIHALRIEGTMGPYSKTALAVLVVCVFAKALWDLRLLPRPAAR